MGYTIAIEPGDKLGATRSTQAVLHQHHWLSRKEMGIKHADYLHGDRVYGCENCRAHITESSEVISRQFQGPHGKAMLVHKVVNVLPGKPEDRNLRTGLHTVRDIVCRRCGLYLGWDYVDAFNLSQKFKIGKAVVERTRVVDLTS